MRHIITILLQNEAGALGRVAGLFSTRGYNIESLNVAPTDEGTVSRLTLVTTGSDEVIAQINKQLAKLVDVVNIVDMTSGDHIERELALIKLSVEDAETAEVKRVVAAHGGNILDDEDGQYTAELTGGVTAVDDFINAVRPHAEILALVRTGVMAVARGQPVLTHR
ncbi:MAG: acetolactate synthase small subunit [Gammaproteobacteria bacterium]